MRVGLLFSDRDLELDSAVIANEPTITTDLELAILWGTMARGDDFLRTVSQHVLLSPLKDPHQIHYRQQVLQDCLRNPSLVREIYRLAVLAAEREKKSYFGFFSRYPSAVLGRAIEVLEGFSEILKKLYALAETHQSRFASEGFSQFLSMIIQEVGPDYLEQIHGHLRELKFPQGLYLSARLGLGNKGCDYVLNPRQKPRGWVQRLTHSTPRYYAYVVASRDEAGAKALSELWDRGINSVANALAQSVDHILSFFIHLRTELGFYLGCINLHEALVALEEPACFPVPVGVQDQRFSAERLYDPCLALKLGMRVTDNDVEADQKDLIIITGANQGGKSTFLRSVGIAYLMMQSGMFVAAASFQASVSHGVFTHYKREEDRAMVSGKLDEELKRMSEIVDQIEPHAVVLFNESCTATNEREGAEISRQILRALMEKQIKAVFVTHLYELARKFYQEPRPTVLFLRAARETNAKRTFKIVDGAPLETSYGDDLYRQIFEES